jgi:pilus assembly protein CpaE
MKQTAPEISTMSAFTVCADASLRALLLQAPATIAGLEFAGEFQDYISAQDRPHFPPGMRSALCCIALIDFDRDAAAALETVEILNRMSTPRFMCIGVSAQVDTELLLRAMRAGCSEFLQKPVELGLLQSTLERIQNRLASAMESSAARGRVLPVFGAKGGVGTTTLAVHLAAYLAKRGKKTLLIDHAHQLGHVGLYLGLKESKYYFDELLRNVERLDSELASGFLMRHSSGLSVIASPNSCAMRHRTTQQDMERVFDFLRHEFDYIVVDSSFQYEDAAPALAHLSDAIYLVATPDVAALRDLSRHIENLNLSEAGSSGLRIVINRSSSQDAIGAEQIHKAIRFPVSVSIPNHYAELVQAINAGEPIWGQRRSEFSTQMSKWVTQVIAESGDSSAVTVSAPKKKFSFWK